MTRGINDQFEQLFREDPLLACQLRNMTSARVRDVRNLTFNGASHSQLSQNDVLDAALDHFAAIAREVGINDPRKLAPNEIEALTDKTLADLRRFAQDRGITVNEDAIRKEVGALSSYFASGSFRKSLDKANDDTTTSRECLLM